MSQTKIDYTIDHACKQIRCLPEPLSSNQFVAALFTNFMSSDFYYSLPNTTTYAFIEGLWSLFNRLLVNDYFYYTRHRYLTNYLYGDYDLEEFVRIIRSPCVFFKNTEEYIELYEDHNDYIPETLRFFEFVMLVSFLNTRTFHIYDDKSIRNAIDNYEELIMKTCDKLCQSNNMPLFDYLDEAHTLTEVIEFLLSDIDELTRLKRSEFLNEIHDHVHKNPEVHPRVKNALHIYL